MTSHRRAYLVVGDPILDVYVRGRVVRRGNEGDFGVYEATDADRTVLGGAMNLAEAVAAADPTADVRCVLPSCVWEGRKAATADSRVDYFPLSDAAAYRRPILTKTRYLEGEGGPVVLCVEPPRAGYYSAVASLYADAIAAIFAARPDYAAVLVSDYGAGLATPGLIRTLRRVLPGARLYLDPHPTSDPRVCGTVDAVKLNAKELAALRAKAASASGGPIFVDPERPTRRIETVVTDGENRVFVEDAEGWTGFVEPPAAPRVVDSCGAGDVFFAYYVVRRTRGESARRAAVVAAAAAVRTLAYRGNHVPTAADVEYAVRMNERFAFA